MGYDLHITRAKSWALNSNDRISADEWLAYVEKDRELSLSRDGGPYFAKWTGKSKLNEPWLDWHDGNIETKNPDEALIDKMVAIARDWAPQSKAMTARSIKAGMSRLVIRSHPFWIACVTSYERCSRRGR
jgi:hypothetical protein